MAIMSGVRGRRTKPMSDEEREAIRQRMAGNQYGAGRTLSPEARKAISERMKKNNPMKRAAVAKKMAATIKKRHGANFHSELFKRLWREGKIKGGRKLSRKEREAASVRMKAANPMKRGDVVERVKRSYSPERRRALSEQMKKSWREGRITPVMFLGKRKEKGANKTERMLFPFVRRHGGRFVGDGTFWIKNTASGICRNPDFIFGSGTEKVALLVHGVYWHRDAAAVEKELNDYRQAGWQVFVLWTKRISPWMMEPIKAELRSWLAGLESLPLRTPEARQFMTWNVVRITTSSRKGS